MSQVAVLKLSNGQELITKIHSMSSEGDYFVSSPLLVVAMRDGSGNFRIELAPFSWVGNTETSFKIGHEHVVCQLQAESQMESQYLAGLAGLSLPGTPTPAAPASSAPRLMLVE